MEKLYTRILGISVVDSEDKFVAFVKDILIDPATGKVCAFEVGPGRNKVVVPRDVVNWTNSLKINNRDSVVESSDILRVEEILTQDIRIFKNSVEDKNGVYIGKVFDFGIDTSEFRIKNLHTSKDFFGFFKQDKRIISAKDIIEILADKIIVQENKRILKEGQRERKFSVGGMAKA